MSKHNRGFFLLIVAAPICLLLISGYAVSRAQDCQFTGSTETGNHAFPPGWEWECSPEFPLVLAGLATVSVPGTYQYSTTGGIAPYTFSASGSGVSIDASTGLATFSSGCTFILSVSDKCGKSASVPVKSATGHWRWWGGVWGCGLAGVLGEVVETEMMYNGQLVKITHQPLCGGGEALNCSSCSFSEACAAAAPCIDSVNVGWNYGVSDWVCP